MRNWITIVEGRKDLTAADLETKFGNEATYRIRFNRDEDCDCFPDGWAAAICTHWALQVKKKLRGRAKIMGFTFERNPSSKVGRDWCEGHDFAVVDGRYIVDGWLKFYDNGPKAVFDLQDPADAQAIAHYYGDPTTWEENPWSG